MNSHPQNAPSFGTTEKILGFLGLIPFVYLAIGLPVPSAYAPIQLFNLYGLSILCFMAGSLWRYSRENSLFAVCLTLLAALLFMLLPPGPLVPGFMLLFGVLWAWEWKINSAKYPADYWRLRCQLTAVVLICHLWLVIKLSSI